MNENISYTDTLFSLNHVYLEYEPGKPVLRDVNAKILNLIRPGYTQGQVVSLLGPSGVGKSSLFQVMSGRRPPTSGSIKIGPEQVPVTDGIVGVVAQQYPLIRHRRVGENLVKAATQRGHPIKRAEKEARDLLKRFNLSDQWDAWPATLSGGQRQRVAIAQQILCSETILLMDEPFSGLDPNAKEDACQLIAEVAGLSEEFTIVIVTHDIGSAVRAADHIWLLGRDRREDGSIVPGAYIKETIDLVVRGLPWQPNIEQLPAFTRTVQEIHQHFREL